ncbi:hypothetical protein NECID01_2079 [Nematocida sp. AWRm77]|nr:hypothetical protein NECID01_2079 [Nematocida sp. AWRm77]
MSFFSNQQSNASSGLFGTNTGAQQRTDGQGFGQTYPNMQGMQQGQMDPNQTAQRHMGDQSQMHLRQNSFGQPMQESMHTPGMYGGFQSMQQPDFSRTEQGGGFSGMRGYSGVDNSFKSSFGMGSGSGWAQPQSTELFQNMSSADNTSSQSLFGRSKNGSMLNAALGEFPGQTDVWSRVDYLEKCYNRSTQFYKFIYIFYNLIDYTQPRSEKPLDVPCDVWEQGLQQNPSPETLTPSVVFGYKDLLDRLEKQRTIIERLVSSKKYLREKVSELVEGGNIRLANKIKNITDKYNTLLVNVFEHIAKKIGPEVSSVVIQYEQLEKKASFLSENLNTLSENLNLHKRVFNTEKLEMAVSILSEQKVPLTNMVNTLRAKLDDTRQKKY